MQNASGGGIPVRSDQPDDSYRSVASDLVSLMERVKASMALVESALAREAPAGDQETTAGIFVLDDVTPRYARARAALNACSAGLGAALHVLLDTSASSQETSAPAECGLAFADRA